MTNEPPDRSGSRWEPPATGSAGTGSDRGDPGEQDDGGESTQPVRPVGDASPEPPAAGETPSSGLSDPAAAVPEVAAVADEQSAPSWRERVGRPVAAVAAAGVVAAVGVGGFAVGRATGEDHAPAPTSFTRDGGTDRGGVPQEGLPDPDNGYGQPWQGQHDRRWDDHDGQDDQDGRDGSGGAVPGGARAADGPAMGT